MFHSKDSDIAVTLWLFNIAMENYPFIDDVPIKTTIFSGFSMAMLNNQMIKYLLRISLSGPFGRKSFWQPERLLCRPSAAERGFAGRKFVMGVSWAIVCPTTEWLLFVASTSNYFLDFQHLYCSYSNVKKHRPVITICMGGINHQFDGWFMALLYPH